MERDRLVRPPDASARADDRRAQAGRPAVRQAPATPESGWNAELVLELQASAGNDAVGRLLGRSSAVAGGGVLARDRGTPSSGTQAPDAGADVGPEPEPPEMRERLDGIERSYREMIASARRRGANVAADNLEWFLAGTGGTKTLSVSWLRGFAVVTDAEQTNQGRFETSLNRIANEMRHGDRRTFTDHWDRMLTASQGEELFYASGTSTIRSTGTFELSMIENQVTISGHVDHHWFDPYDWHAGLSAYIPGHGSVSDEDGLLMQRYRGAKPFQMEADWRQTLSGRIDVGRVWNTKTFTWSGP
jgi:hypothetical protein